MGAHHCLSSAYSRQALAKPRMEASVLYMPITTPAPSNSWISCRSGGPPLDGVYTSSTLPEPGITKSVALYWSPKACLCTRHQKITSKKRVPACARINHRGLEVQLISAAFKVRLQVHVCKARHCYSASVSCWQLYHVGSHAIFAGYDKGHWHMTACTARK